MRRAFAAALFGGAVGGIVPFVAGYALFDALPVLLSGETPLGSMGLGDLVDAPLVFLLVALYVRLGLEADLWRSAALRLANAAVLVLLVQGHGVHLAANAIAGTSDPTSSGWDLTYFLDEHWGHLELHLAIILMALLFITAGRQGAGVGVQGLAVTEKLGLGLSVALYGVLLAADAIEGQTVPLVLPAGIVLFVLGFSVRRDTPSLHRVFFASAYAIAVLALVGYGLIHAGYPQLSEL